jgi:hypothetical protein
MQNSIARMALVILCWGCYLSAADITLSAASERNLEEQIDRVIRIFRDDAVTRADYEFVLSVPKEVVPLLIKRLERERRSPQYSSAFGLLANKLKQFEGEISDDVRRSAVRLMVETCESATNEIALMYLSDFRGLNDPKILEMARRMKDRPDVNLQQATARLLEATESVPPPLERQGPSVTPARTTATPTPATPVTTAKPIISPAPITQVDQTPSPTVQRRAPVWPWLVGIAALVVVVAVVSKRRA